MLDVTSPPTSATMAVQDQRASMGTSRDDYQASAYSEYVEQVEHTRRQTGAGRRSGFQRPMPYAATRSESAPRGALPTAGHRPARTVGGRANPNAAGGGAVQQQQRWDFPFVVQLEDGDASRRRANTGRGARQHRVDLRSPRDWAAVHMECNSAMRTRARTRAATEPPCHYSSSAGVNSAATTLVAPSTERCQGKSVSEPETGPGAGTVHFYAPQCALRSSNLFLGGVGLVDKRGSRTWRGPRQRDSGPSAAPGGWSTGADTVEGGRHRHSHLQTQRQTHPPEAAERRRDGWEEEQAEEAEQMTANEQQQRHKDTNRRQHNMVSSLPLQYRPIMALH